jgi:hypothetical protein
MVEALKDERRRMSWDANYVLQKAGSIRNQPSYDMRLNDADRHQAHKEKIPASAMLTLVKRLWCGKPWQSTNVLDISRSLSATALHRFACGHIFRSVHTHILARSF